MDFLNCLISIKSKMATSVCVKTSHSSSGFTRIRTQLRIRKPGTTNPELNILSWNITLTNDYWYTKHIILMKPDLTTRLFISFEDKIATSFHFVFRLERNVVRQTQTTSLIFVAHPKRSARAIFQTLCKTISNRRLWCTLKTAAMGKFVSNLCHPVKSFILYDVPHYQHEADERPKNIALIHV